MFARRCAGVTLGLIILGATTAAAQSRATVQVHARVQNVQPSRKSLQVALEVVASAVGQIGRGDAPKVQRVTPHGVVTVRPAACGDDACQHERIATIAFW